MAAAVMTGVYGFQSPVQFECTSNNCTFPDFTSLGVCSECEDVTESTVENCTSPGLEQYCYYQLPNGAILSGLASDDAHNGFVHTQVNTTVLTNESNNFTSLNLTKHGVPIIYLGLVRFPNRGEFDLDNWHSGYQVFQCDMYFCAQKFKGMTVKNGTVDTQEVLQRDMNSTTAGGPLIGIRALQPWEGDSNFTINYYDLQNIPAFLQSVLDFSNFYYDGLITTSIQGALTTSTNIPNTITGIATSISNHIRAGPNSTNIVGDAWLQKTYIHVHWVWLTEPIILVLVASLLLGSVIVLTHRDFPVVWKSSLLPMMLLHLESEREEYSGEDEWTLSKMETRAKDIKSWLLVQEGKRPVWKFN